jgi:hypothetical protein
MTTLASTIRNPRSPRPAQTGSRHGPVCLRRSDGSTGSYGVVDSPDIALIIPADGDRLHLVEQYRYPVAGRR